MERLQERLQPPHELVVSGRGVAGERAEGVPASPAIAGGRAGPAAACRLDG
jgi:hypothetical protein